MEAGQRCVCVCVAINPTVKYIQANYLLCEEGRFPVSWCQWAHAGQQRSLLSLKAGTVFQQLAAVTFSTLIHQDGARGEQATASTGFYTYSRTDPKSGVLT